jgi:son of sevenless-like protein
MMSKFSKLVLSSHIAAADWPTPDSYSKCLQEADGFLQGVYGYVDVARRQRGEEIPRLMPGFTVGSHCGGNWQNNGIGNRDTAAFVDPDEEPAPNPNARLDTDLLIRLDDLKKIIVSSIRRLDDQLIIHDKIVSPQRHEIISSGVCSGAARVLEDFKPWITIVESINLSAFGAKNPNPTTNLHNPQLVDFSGQKQRLYDLISDLMMTCQAVAAPLGDEWAEVRADPLEDRLKDVRIASKQLETCTSQLILSLQLLLEIMPREDEILREEIRRAEGGPVRYHQRPRNGPGDGHLFADGVDDLPEPYRKGESSKLKKFFGELPVNTIPTPPREPDETPSYLRLDHENELSFDEKSTPPILRGGTLPALVEQLTRHDKLDSTFNNTFLLTYRSFTSASELFDMLVGRFTIQPPSGLANMDLQMWVERKQKLIRLRVVNILKSWFDNYWMEPQDENSKRLIRRVFAFAKDSVATANTPGAQPLMAVLEQRLLGQETNAKRLVKTSNTTIPPPILPKNMKKLKFLDIDVTEFARQLTIIESRLYGKIKPSECLNKTWQKKVDDSSEVAVNVKSLILHSNQLTNWVAHLILTQSDVKKRVAVIKHFVSIADVCLFCPRHITV